MGLFFRPLGFWLFNFRTRCKCAGLADRREKARIHTGEVRRPQYELMRLINELRITRDAPGAPPVESSRQSG
jgi:hypothetical protein